MGRYLAGFVLGMLVGAVALSIGGSMVWEFVGGPAWWESKRVIMSRAQFAAWESDKSERFQIAFLGALGCFGLLGAYFFNRPFGRVLARRRRSRPGSDDPLTQDEFKRVFQSCQWLALDEVIPEFVRGFTVARLAETVPAVAKKLADFSDSQMAAVYSDLMYNWVAGRSHLRSTGASMPTEDERKRMSLNCCGIDVGDRRVEFVRGFLVGRLAESDPALAKKVLDLNGWQMTALRNDLCRARSTA